jgi:ribosomal protein L21
VTSEMVNKLVYIKNVKLKEFGSRNLSIGSTSYVTFQINNTNRRLNELTNYYKNQSNSIVKVTSLTLNVTDGFTFAQILAGEKKAGTNQYTIKAVAVEYEVFKYSACANVSCFKSKLVDDDNNNKFCPMCNGTNDLDAIRLNLLIDDGSERLWVCCFDPLAQQLLTCIENGTMEFNLTFRLTLSKVIYLNH